MAWIKIKEAQQTGARASQLTARSQKKRSSGPSEPAPVPDIPSPLAELPAEGSRRAKSKFPAGHSNHDGGDKRYFAGSRIAVGASSVTSQRGGKRNATRR
jgi:hypothetical protein